MIATDTSSLVAYLQGEEASDVKRIAAAIHDETLIIPPFVISEIFSARSIPAHAKATIAELPSFPIQPDFWTRSGHARLQLLEKGFKARTLDCYFAVYCLDHALPLVTRDSDFRHFAAEFDLSVLR